MNTPHTPTGACLPVHCHVHHVDEPDAGAYRVCGECGHVYATARDLRRAYRRAVLRHIPGGVRRWRLWWRAATVRASRVSFCQHCAHDF